MPAFDGHRLRNLGKAVVGAGQQVAAHVNIAELARVGLGAVLTGGTPAGMGVAFAKGVLTDLPAILPNTAHQAAASDAVVAGVHVAKAIGSLRDAIAATPAPPATAAP